MLRRILALAKLTLLEGIRDRTLYGITIFAILMMGITIITISFFMRELSKVTVDMTLSAITFAELLVIFSISVNLMAKDIDKHTIYCVLSKPLSRSEYLVGKYIGLASLLLIALIILTMMGNITVLIIKSGYPYYFTNFSWVGFYQAIYSEFLMLLVLNAIVVFFSTVCTSSFLSLLLSIAFYIIGETIEEAVHFIEKQAQFIEFPKLVKYSVIVAQYIFPNLSAYDLKLKASHNLLISPHYLLNLSLYTLTYIAILLSFSALIFNRRELV